MLYSAQSVLDGSPVPTFVLNMEGTVVYWNHACELITGISADSVIGTTDAWRGFYQKPRPVLANFIISHDIESSLKHYGVGNCKPSKNVPFAYEAEGFFAHLGKSGKWLFFTAAPMFDADGLQTGAIETLQDITDFKTAEIKIKKLAYYDSLTNLPNRVLFEHELERALAYALRKKSNITIGYLDLDGFKTVNDCYGHDAGDIVLETVAERVKSVMREYDCMARLGGDEFAFILMDINVEAKCTAFFQRIIKLIEQPILIEDTEVQVSASIGYLIYDFKTELSIDNLLRYADHAMYLAKSGGKHQVCKFCEEHLTDCKLYTKHKHVTQD